MSCTTRCPVAATFLTEAESRGGTAGWSTPARRTRGTAPSHSPLRPERRALWVSAERLPPVYGPVSARPRRSPRGNARSGCAISERRGRAGGSGSRAAGGCRTHHSAGTGAVAGTAGRYRHRCRPRRAAGRRICHARRIHQRGSGGQRVVRAAATGAHPPLHREAPAGSRSSPSTRATSCDSCSSGNGSRRCCVWKARMRSARSWRSLRASSPRRAPGRPRSCPTASAIYEPAWLDEQCCLAGRFVWT